MKIPAGDLRERVKLYAPSTTQDAAGQEVITWPTATETRWAKRMPIKADERVMAARVQDDVVERFIVRKGTAATTRWRLEWVNTGQTYDITGVTVMPDRMWVELICKRGVGDGR